MGEKPFVIKPISSASSSQIVENAIKNMDSIGKWTKRLARNGRDFVLFSGGPGTEDFFNKGGFVGNRTVVCIKHALPILNKFNVVPDICVVLDPRPIDGVSTFGIPRTLLYSSADKKTTFFVASMTHWSVTKWLMDNGYKVIGFHALTPELVDLPPKYKSKVDLPIQGGTNSSTRSLELMYQLGFEKAFIVGLDCCFKDPMPLGVLDSSGKPTYVKIKVLDKYYYSTGEMIASFQDLEKVISNKNFPLEVTFYDPGEWSLSSVLANKVVNQTINKETYEQFFNR